MKKYLLIALCCWIANSLVAQVNPNKVLSKTELDTAFFDKTVYVKYFDDNDSDKKDSFKIDKKLDYWLFDAAEYNQFIGNTLKESALTLKFHFNKMNNIDAVTFYLKGDSFTVLNELRNGKGLYIQYNCDMDCTQHRITVDEYKNGVENGFSYIGNFTGQLFSLEQQEYKQGQVCGKYTSYYIDGKIAIEGDSNISVNPHLVKVAVYDSIGTNSGYKFIMSYDIKKKGSWKYYNEKGELIKEEHY